MKTAFFFFSLLFFVLFSQAEAQMRDSRPQPILVDEIGPSGSRRSSRASASRPRERISPAPQKKKRSSLYAIERTTFELVNSERASRGLVPLVWDEGLAELARLHSDNMATLGFFSHRGRDGLMVDDRADMLGISDWSAIGENIAFIRGYGEPEATAVEKWLDSPSHRRNILNAQWQESAIGVALSSDGSYYFTQVFILRP